MTLVAKAICSIGGTLLTNFSVHYYPALYKSKKPGKSAHRNGTLALTLWDAF